MSGQFGSQYPQRRVTAPTGEECGWVLTGYLQGIELKKKARLAEDRVL